MKRIAIFCMLSLPLVAWAQKQYYLPTAGTVDDEKDKPMIEVYLPQHPNGCAVVLCPGGAMRWLSWESDVVKMASFLNEQGIAAIGLRYHLNKTPMPQGMKMPPMVDVTHPEVFPQADANHRSARCTSPAHYDSCRPSQCGSRTYCPVHGVEEVWGECRIACVWRRQRSLRTDAANGRDHH